MLIATITFLTIMFGGGVLDAFYIDKLDKGVKQYVVDTERKKEIRAALKVSKKQIKQFNKQRKEQFKNFREMFREQSTVHKDFTDIFETMQQERKVHEDKVVNDRIAIVAKIEPQEWKGIIELSDAAVEKRQAKAQEKVAKNEAKGRQGFDKTRKCIVKVVEDSEKQKVIVTGLDNMMEQISALDDKIKAINSRENELLVRQDSTVQEIQKIVRNLDQFRKISYEHLLEFRQVILDNTSDLEWKKLAKTFSKELSITAR